MLGRGSTPNQAPRRAHAHSPSTPTSSQPPRKVASARIGRPATAKASKRGGAAGRQHTSAKGVKTPAVRLLTRSARIPCLPRRPAVRERHDACGCGRRTRTHGYGDTKAVRPGLANPHRPARLNPRVPYGSHIRYRAQDRLPAPRQCRALSPVRLPCKRRAATRWRLRGLHAAIDGGDASFARASTATTPPQRPAADNPAQPGASGCASRKAKPCRATRHAAPWVKKDPINTG